MTSDGKVADSLENLFCIFNHWIKYRFKDYFIQNEADLTLNQYRVLYILKQHGKIRMSELSECLNTTLGSLTIMIDRLIDKNLVERSFSAEDRRIVLVSITRNGEYIIKEFREGFIKLLAKDIEKLSESDKAVFHTAATQIKSIISNNLI